MARDFVSDDKTADSRGSYGLDSFVSKAFRKRTAKAICFSRMLKQKCTLQILHAVQPAG
jgi:hypothetical protein